MFFGNFLFFHIYSCPKKKVIKVDPVLDIFETTRREWDACANQGRERVVVLNLDGPKCPLAGLCACSQCTSEPTPKFPHNACNNTRALALCLSLFLSLSLIIHKKNRECNDKSHVLVTPSDSDTTTTDSTLCIRYTMRIIIICIH